MKPELSNHFLPVLLAATGILTPLVFAGGTIVTNNTGIAAASFTFMDDVAAAIVSGGIGGYDGDANAYGDNSKWGTTVSINYPFTGLTPNANYNIYSTWHFGGGGVGMTVKVGTSTIATVPQNNGNSPNTAAGFTAYDNVSDLPADTRNFQLLGTATTDASGNLTVNAATSSGSTYIRWDCFAVAPAPALPPPGPRYWDGNATTANSTSDNSATTAMNWFNGGNWDNGTTSVAQVAWNSGDAATFGGTMAGTQTITLIGGVTTSALTFDTAGYTLTGGVISNFDTGTITTNADATINSALSAVALIKAGTGTLTRGSATAFTSLLVSAGKLVCATGGFNALTSNMPITISNATVSTDSTVNNANNVGAVTLNGGTLTSAGGPAGQANDGGWGNWILQAPTTVGGTAPSTISSTTLVLKGGNFTVADVTVSPATDLLISANITNDAGGTVSSISKTGPGTLELTGTNTYTGTTTVNEGMLKLGATSSVGASRTITVATGATLDLSATAGLALTSTKTLAGGGTVLGAVTIDGGAITATGPLSVTSLTMNSSASFNVVPGARSLTITATDGLNTGATGSFMTVNIGTTPITSGTYHLVQYNGAIQGVDGFAAFELGTTPGGDYTYDLVHNGTFIDLVVAPLAKLWTGALDSEWTTAPLGLPKNWKAGVNPSDFVTHDDVLFDDSAGNTTVAINTANVSPNSVLFGNLTKTYTLQGTSGITGTTNLTKAGTGTLIINNNNSFSGTPNLDGGTVSVAVVADGGSDSPLGAGTEIVFGGGTLAFTGSSGSTNRMLTLDPVGTIEVTPPGTTLTLSGEITGSSFTKIGAGTLAPTFDNTYTGATRIHAGTLSVATLPDGGLPSPLGQSSNAAAGLVLGGGTLSYTGATAACNRGFTLTAATTSAIAVTDPAAALTLSGAVTGAGNLVKAGPGTLVRSTNLNSYTSLAVEDGKFSVNTGGFNGLRMDGATSVGQGAVLSADNAAFNAHNLGILTLTGGTLTSVNGPAGPANDDGFGNWVVAGVTVGGSVPSLISSSSLLMKTSGTGLFDVADVTGSDATDLLVSASIMEDGIYTIGAPLTKNGPGTMELTGRNTYTGTTTVNAGTLVLADDAHLTFAISNINGNSNKLTGAGSVILNGDFAINTSAVTTLTTGTWLLENVASLTGAYGTSFTVVDPDGTVWSNIGSEQWLKITGTKTWIFDETTGTLTLSVTVFSSWIKGFGLAAADQDPTDDPDNDGVNNLTEYALAGRNPAVSDGPAGTFTGGLLSFAKRTDASGITCAIQESDDLGVSDPWAPATATTDTAAEITWQMLPADRAKRFARLVVTLTP